MSVYIVMAFSIVAEARPKSHKLLSGGEPGTCSEIGGLWEGECMENGKALQAKLQIFQDHCTDIAFFDFDGSIPQVYKIGREGRAVHTKFADSFANFTAYASWSEDRKTFKANILANAEYTIANKARMNKLEETFTVTLMGETLETIIKGEIATDGSNEGYQTKCSYRRAN